MNTDALRALPLAALLAVAACGNTPEAPAVSEPSAAPAPDLSALPAPIAAAAETHVAHLPAGRALAYTLNLSFGGKPRFSGSVTHTPSMDRIVMARRRDGAELRYDGTGVTFHGSPTGETWPGARFAVFTWPYFATAPYKLADPGTRWAPARDYPWTDGAPAPGARLTFAAGTGDAPDDYYVVFPDAESRVDGMAYVVTFGKPDAEADDLDPHAIRYHDYRDVGGVPVAHRWTFHNWNPTDGLDSTLIGYADLTDVRWVDLDEAAFATDGGEPVPRS